MIVEWNAHIFSPDRERHPFHPRAAYTPDLSAAPADPLGAYLERMEREGIDRAVLVHPEPYGDDHRLILECLEREPERLRGTCLFYPKDPEAPRKMAALVAATHSRGAPPRIVAVRFHAHRGKESYLDSFADRGVRALWEKALELGLIIELHIGPNYAASAAEALRAYPESTVLIDHLAEPHMGDAVEYAHVLDLAAFDRVTMKLSGLGHFAQDAPLYPSARPFTRRVVEAFGPDRMVWGGGTPGIVDAHMEGYPERDRMKVKGGNLARLLGFE
jgi:predicted TIM-barrel fold metal-dependent hydrolase